MLLFFGALEEAIEKCLWHQCDCRRVSTFEFMNAAIVLVNDRNDSVQPLQFFSLIPVKAQRRADDALHVVVHGSASVTVISLESLNRCFQTDPSKGRSERIIRFLSVW